MLVKLIERAEGEKVKLAPFMGIGCPGLIDEHGTILKGGQNLPGNWEGDGFNLAVALGKRLPRIGGHDVFIQIHNDAVVQGLSEVPNMKDVSHWGVMTIGTGLGNARFTNRAELEGSAWKRRAWNASWSPSSPPTSRATAATWSPGARREPKAHSTRSQGSQQAKENPCPHRQSAGRACRKVCPIL